MANVRYPALTPGQSYSDVNVQEKVGVAFTVTEPTTIQGVYFYSPVANSARSFEIYAGSTNIGTLYAPVVVGDNFVPFSSPVSAVPGTSYIVAVGTYSTVDGASMDYTATAYAGGGTVGPFVFPSTPGRYADRDVTTTTVPETSTNNWYGVGPYVSDSTSTPTPTAVSVSATSSASSLTVGQTATLTATASNGSGAKTYAWTQTAGTTLTIAGASTATAQVTPTVAGSYTFRVTVTDTTGSATSDVSLTATSTPVTPPDPEPEPSDAPTLWIKDEDGNWFRIGGGSSSPAAHPGVFYPEDFGAKGDGTTDDTAAWNNCIAAAVAAAPQHNYAVTVEAQSEEYLIAGAPVKGRQYGNAQITIPHVPANAGRKITLTFRGKSIASTFLHWDQTAPHSLGTVLHSTFASGAYDNTWGVPSILGGPVNLSTAPQDQFATFSNMHVVVDGISTLQPWGASLIGFDFRRIAQAHVVSASSFSDRTRKTTPGIEALTNNDQSVGLVMPLKGNNARAEIGSYTAEGLHTGLVASEHLVAEYVGVIYARHGIQIAGLTGGDWPDGQRRIADHSIYIGRYLAEAVDYWIYNDTTATQLVIDSMGGEGTTNFVAHVYDQISGENGRGGLTGQVRLLDIFQQFAVVEGNTPLRIINDGVLPGLARTTPPVPASNASLRNPFWRDAVVVVSGGTVTSIKVAGVSQGVTSGPVFVPSGQSIEITYSAAPTWTWQLS
jgi:hypothetical protein